MAPVVGTPARLNVSGGLAGLDALCRSLADLTGIPVARNEAREATARGLAWLVAGRPDGWEQAPAATFLPTGHPPLAARYQRWREALAAALDRG